MDPTEFQQHKEGKKGDIEQKKFSVYWGKPKMCPENQHFS